MLIAAAGAVGSLKWGAFAFGAVIGWNLYFINRYRQRDKIGVADLTTVISALGGASILALFPAQTKNFAFYGLGLAAGFFGYLVLLLLLVWRSPDVSLKWFLLGDEKNNPMMVE